MQQLRLGMENKKEIVIDELKARSPRLEMESISSFVKRLLSEYRYSQGADRYFWKAIRELEGEGRVKRLRNGKGKTISLLEERETGEQMKEPRLLKEWVVEKRLEIIKDFLWLWEAYNVWENIPQQKHMGGEAVRDLNLARQ